MKNVIEFLEQYSSFAIFTHQNPDGDALGSAFSLASALLTYRKQAKVILLGAPPYKYDLDEFKPLYMMLEDVDMAGFDACIAVDCADIRRLGDARESFSSRPTLNLDHHKSNNHFAQVNYVEEVAATGEIIYDIMKDMQIPIFTVAQLGIYTAISTDTGNFTYSNTTSKTLHIYSELVDLGMDISYVANRVFNDRTMEATMLICRFIQNMRLHMDGKIATSIIMLEDFKETGSRVEDCESLINYARDIDTVEIAIFIREISQGNYKISLRSKQYVDVAELAERYDGGGHVRAAGCRLNGNIHDVMQTILKSAGEFIR